MDCKHLNHNVGICDCCGQLVAFSENFGCYPIKKYFFTEDCKFKNDLDDLIDFVIKDAFEGLSDTDPSSIERSIRKWFKKCE